MLFLKRIMGSFNCTCGHYTKDSDLSDRLYSKVYSLLQEQTFEEKSGQKIAEFIEAILEGQGDSWLQDMFGNDYPLDIELKEKISDLLSSINLNDGTTSFECSQCGRLHILKQDGLWRIYKPDGECGTKLR
jgi:hypothetical protein